MNKKEQDQESSKGPADVAQGMRRQATAGKAVSGLLALLLLC